MVRYQNVRNPWFGIESFNHQWFDIKLFKHPWYDIEWFLWLCTVNPYPKGVSFQSVFRIRIHQTQGSGSGIRIPNADPVSGSSSSILIFYYKFLLYHPLVFFCVILQVVNVVLQAEQKIIKGWAAFKSQKRNRMCKYFLCLLGLGTGIRDLDPESGIRVWDPYWAKDLDPDPHSTYADPKPRFR